MNSETRANIQEQIRLLIATEVEKERLRCIAIAMQYGHPLIAEAMKHSPHNT